MEKILSCIANGNSMSPEIESGDKITIYTQCNSYNVGDIILFEINNKKILHRIVCIFLCASNTYYITKGDFLLDDDTELIVSTQIIGKAIHVKHIEK